MDGTVPPTQNSAKASHADASPPSSSGIDFKWIVERCRAILTDPKATWTAITAESTSVADFYKRFLVVLAALPAIGSFIGFALVGISVPLFGRWRAPFFLQLVSDLGTYALQLLLVYVMGMVLVWLAPRFSGRADQSKAVQLLGYSLVPCYLAGLLMMFGSPILGLISLLTLLYALYLYSLGVGPMLGISEAKKWPFVAVSVITNLVVGFVLTMVFALIVPSPHSPYQTSQQSGIQQASTTASPSSAWVASIAE